MFILSGHSVVCDLVVGVKNSEKYKVTLNAAQRLLISVYLVKIGKGYKSA